MNTAIAGGFDLAWKLAWVLNGWASESLLDTYETERRPLVEHNLNRSIDPAGSRRPALGELQVDLAGRIPHAWLPDRHTSTLDLVDTGLTLFTAGHRQWRRAAADSHRTNSVDPARARHRHRPHHRGPQRRGAPRPTRRRTGRSVADRPRRSPTATRRDPLDDRRTSRRHPRTTRCRLTPTTRSHSRRLDRRRQPSPAGTGSSSAAASSMARGMPSSLPLGV